MLTDGLYDKPSVADQYVQERPTEPESESKTEATTGKSVSSVTSDAARPQEDGRHAAHTNTHTHTQGAYCADGLTSHSHAARLRLQQAILKQSATHTELQEICTPARPQPKRPRRRASLLMQRPARMLHRRPTLATSSTTCASDLLGVRPENKR